jgi:hypothetical protein
VPIKVPESLSEKILYMVEDRNRMKKMGSMARARFNERYRAETYSLHFENLYRELISTHKHKSISKDEEMLLKIFLDSYRDLSVRDRDAFEKYDLIRDMSNSWGWKVTLWLRGTYAFLVKLKRTFLKK